MSNDGFVRDFCDGNSYSSHQIISFDHWALQINSYFDELEVCDALRSSAKKHNAGIFFFTIGNIHPKFDSSLKCIILFAVANSEDIKAYGTGGILQPFIRNLNKFPRMAWCCKYLHSVVRFWLSLGTTWEVKQSGTLKSQYHLHTGFAEVV